MAEKDPLQNSINRLDNTMNALDKTVKGLTKAFNDMNRTEKSRKVTSSIRPNFEERLTSALTKVAPLTKKGTPRKDFTFAVEKLFEQQRDVLTKYDKIREYGYNKDNPSSKLSDIYGIKEVQKIVNEMLSDLESKKNGISKDDSKSVRKELFGDNKGVSVDNSYKIIQSMQDNSEVILRTAGVFAQVRSEVANFQNAIKNATNTVSSNLSSNSKKVSNRLEKMASDSKALKDVLANLNHSVTRANKAVDRFADRLSTATRLISNNNRRLSGSVTSINSLVKKVQKTTSTINNIQNNLSKKNSGSSYSDNNTFREQATRNSDRAKQAGFIALLIPALAKLLKKTPVTDLLKLLFLRIGAGFHGKGGHPVVGAIGIMAAPVIAAGLLSAGFRKQLFSMTGKLLGSGSTLAKNSGTATKGFTGIGKIPTLSGKFQYAQGIKDGFTASKDSTFSWQKMLTSKGYAKKIPGTAYRDPSNKMRWLHNLEPESGMVAGNLGVNAGRRLSNLTRIRTVGALGAKPLGGSVLAKGLTKGIAKRIPFLGTAIGAAFEVPDLIKAHKTGDKRLMGAQVAKSVGGVTGGAIGMAAGGALGGLTGPLAPLMVPLGAAIGGMVGDSLGRHVGPFFRTIFTGQKDGNKMFNTFAETTMKMAGLQAEEHPIITKILDCINPLPNLVLWIWNKLKNMPFGGDNNANGGAAFDHAGDESDKLIEKIKKQEKELNELKVGGKEYNKLWKKYQNEYKGATARKNGVYGTAEDKEALKYKSADEYAMAKIVEKVNSLKHSIAASKSNLSNAVNIDKNQLVNANDLYTWSKSKVEQELKQRTGAYEKLNDRKGYWSVSHGSFQTDVEYAGKGTQARLQKMVDDHVLPAGFSITSAMGSGTLNSKGKHGHSKGGGHYNPLGNVMDITYANKRQWEVAMNGGVWNGVKYTGLNKAKGNYLRNVIDERYGQPGNRWARMGENTHLEFATTTLTDTVKAYQSEIKAQENQGKSKNTTVTQVESASSGVRDDLLSVVGSKEKSTKQERARSIVLSAVDVTGSLGVWGITQLNNGVMKTGR